MTLSRRQFLQGASSAAIAAVTDRPSIGTPAGAETLEYVRHETFFTEKSLYDYIMEGVRRELEDGFLLIEGELGTFQGIRFTEEDDGSI